MRDFCTISIVQPINFKATRKMDNKPSSTVQFLERLLFNLFMFLILFIPARYVVDYFWGSKPVVVNVCERPLQTEVSVIQSKKKIEPHITRVMTSWGELEFSTHGGLLNRLTFIHPEHSTKNITTIFPLTPEFYGTGMFMLARNQALPIEYTLKERVDGNETVTLTYESVDEKQPVLKTFIVYRNIHQIDLQITARNVDQENPIRIFVPSPLLVHLLQDSTGAAFIIKASDDTEKINASRLALDKTWSKPRAFGAADRYFIHTLFTKATSPVQRAYYTKYDNQLIAIYEIYNQTLSDATGDVQQFNLSFYIGPKQQQALQAVNTQLVAALDYSTYFSFLSKWLLAALNWFYAMTGNYGIAIILLTIVLKLLLLPFSYQSERSMKQHADMQKKLNYLNRKYKDNPDMLKQEREELLKKEGIGPIFGSCLPLLLQVPFFFALNRVISYSVEFYQAPMWWISDLSSYDPYYIIPLLVFMVTIVNALVMKGDGQQKTSMLFMAVLMGGFSASFSAGSGIFVLTNALGGIIQSLAIQAINKR